MNVRERFAAVMSGRPFDRLPILEWATWWDKTIDRWRGEGLPAQWRNWPQISDGLGLDPYRQWWISPRLATCPRPLSHGAGLITSAAEYETLRQQLYPDLHVFPEQLEQWRRWVEQQQQGRAVLWITLEGFFWFPRTLLGIERHLYAFYDQPELMHRINEDLAAWYLRVIEQLSEIGLPDFMTFAEDMSYNMGPMLGEGQFDEIMLPYYQRVVPALRNGGVLPLVDSDGDVTPAVEWFEHAGIAGILPLERQAGVDVARLRREHPSMCFVGHFDKMVMTRGEQAMRAEFERLLPVAARGRYLISCDHQTPPGVSWADYAVYLRLFREYAERAGRMSQELATV